MLSSCCCTLNQFKLILLLFCCSCCCCYKALLDIQDHPQIHHHSVLASWVLALQACAVMLGLELTFENTDFLYNKEQNSVVAISKLYSFLSQQGLYCPTELILSINSATLLRGSLDYLVLYSFLITSFLIPSLLLRTYSCHYWKEPEDTY